MKKIFLINFLILTSCSLNTFDLYKDELQNFASSSFDNEKNANDVNNLTGCEVLVDLQGWIADESIRNKTIYYSRHQQWIKGTRMTETGVSLDFDPKQNSALLTNKKSIHVSYIGPWETATLTEIKGSFPFYKTIKETRQIRFFVYQEKDGGSLRYQYESMNEQNKNIPEKKFSLSPVYKHPPDKFSLCVVKWTVKFGYNAIAEVKSKNLFSKNYMVPTGKIIEAKE